MTTPEFYTCRSCKKENFLQEEMKWESGLYSRCFWCYNKYKREYSLKLRKKGIPPRRRFDSKYGITVKQYDKLVELHLGGCAICKLPCSRHTRLSIDHNHKTKKVRGLLCNRCNTVLGRIKEDEDILSGMIEYLKNDGVLTGISY